MDRKKWPKSRPQMSEKVRRIYEENYLSNRAGVGIVNNLTMRLEGWMHRKISAHQSSEDQVLEIGPGNLNHAPYLKCAAWDVVEPYDPLYQSGAKHHHLVRNRFRDISEVSVCSYDRVISVAVLEHICDLPDLMEKSFEILKPGGKFQAAIPSEGGFLWKLMSWHLKGFFFRRKYNANYKEIMRWEHVNNAQEIIEEVRKTFGKVEIRRFPFLGPQLSLYSYVEATKNI